MAVTFYRSTDTSAPSLTGAVGSLVALLDACLVNGYGSQAAAGWTIAYTATNKRDYKQGTGSNGYYLDVDDSAPTTAKEARMRGYETMSALATGTQAFPTSAQSSFGDICRKSNTADATARPWYCIADATCFYLFVDTGDFTGPAYSCGFMFGDFFSYKSGDIYNTAIVGRKAENSSSDVDEWLQVINSSANALISTAWPTGHYVDRHWTGVGGSLPFSKFASLLAGLSSGTGGNNTGSSISLCAYPNGPDGALELSPLWIGHQGNVRGYLKGLWCPLHFQPCGHGDTFTGTGNMAGKSFLALNMRNSNVAGSGLLGQIVVETSNTWS
jgi:hypothetical protein